jgi:hypothetical protein
VRVLGLKAVVLAGDVRRPVPAVARLHPELAPHAQWSDTFGIDSEHDYDPVWARCIELGVAATSHTGPIGWATRASISRHQYNQLGGFAEGGEALAKSLFFGGVTRRFPRLHFAFLEGGVAWAASLYARMVEHWRKRGPAGLARLDPAKLDQGLFAELIERYGDARVRSRAAEIVRDSLWSQHPEVLDDWSECGITRAEDIRELFVPRFWFGCEGDDRLNAWAFAAKLNPFGARLNAMLGSDLGHFDVTDMRDVLAEAHELVDEGLISEADFRDFSFANAVRLHEPALLRGHGGRGRGGQAAGRERGQALNAARPRSRSTSPCWFTTRNRAIRCPRGSAPTPSPVQISACSTSPL